MFCAKLSKIALCAVAVLAGCNAPPVQPGETSAVSLGGTEAPKSASLLYLSDVASNRVYVYSYPQGRLIQKLSDFGQPRSECADASGDIWIADVQAFQVVEYAHGASRPSVALSTFGAPRGCSVDPKSGDLAVSGGLNGTILSIFHRGKHGPWRDPERYGDPSIGVAYFCGYDAAGNLFIDGLSKAKGGSFQLAELPRGSGTLVNITVDQSISAPGQVQWDGKYLAVGDAGASPSVIYRFSISGSHATAVGSANLRDSTSLRQFWIHAKTLIGPDLASHVGLWKYPAGGSPTKTIDTVRGYGAAVSLP